MGQRSDFQLEAAELGQFDVVRLTGELDRAFESGDIGRAVELINANHEKLLRDGLAADLVRWIRQLPADVLLGRPDLVLALGQASGLTGDTVTATVVLRSLRASFNSVEESRRPEMLVGLARLESSVLILRGDLRRVHEPFAFLDDPTDRSGAREAVGPFAQGAIRAAVALGHLLVGEFEDAVTIADEVLVPIDVIPATRAAVLAVGVRALALALSGEEVRARQAVLDGHKLLERFTGQSVDPIILHCATVLVAEDPACERSLEIAQEHARTVGSPAAGLLVHLATARLFVRRGLASRAAESLALADETIGLMVDPAYLGTLRDHLEEVIAAGDVPDLTPQEVECLAAISTGLTRSQVAGELHYSLNTVKTHLRHAYAKLGVEDRETAVEKAQLLGLLPAA